MQLRIIDWGLGEFYLPEKDYNVRVSSRYFKGPELLVSYEYYHYSLDIWSLGVMMAGMVFGKEPFFKGSDNYDQLEQITRVLGTEELFAYLNKYNIPLEVTLEKILGDHRAVKLAALATPANAHLATPDALDILAKMMQYDHVLLPPFRTCVPLPSNACATPTSTKSASSPSLSDAVIHGWVRFGMLWGMDGW
jgi:casein kinase II subunit alpha